MAHITTTNFGELSVLHVQPSAPMSESFEHLTDIMDAEDGSEVRIPLRHFPRMQYTYTYPVRKNSDPALYNAIYGGLRKKWGIHVWSQTSRLGAQAAVGSTSIKLEKPLALYDYYPGCLAVLYLTNDVWQVLEVETLDEVENTISFVAPLTRTWTTTSGWVMPMRVGVIVDNAQKTTRGLTHAYDVTYKVIDNPENMEEDTPMQYQGQDVYLQQGYTTGQLTRTMSAKVEETDPLLGRFYVDSPWKNSRMAYNMYFLLETQEDARAMRKRFQRHMGRNKQFWQPSFEINVRCKSISGSTVDIHADDYGYYQEHKNLAFTGMDGTVELREITGVSALDSTTIRLTLDAPLTITKANLFYVAYMGMYRLDSDTMDYTWVGAGKVETTLRVLELRPNLL